MRKSHFFLGVLIFLIAAGTVVSVICLLKHEKQTWRWGPSGIFFNFDGRAVFAQMAEEPAHSVYGSRVYVWVYRNDQRDISEIIITGHAASKVCMRASVQLYETAIKLDVGEYDLLGAGIGRFLGVDPDKLSELRKLPVVQEYENMRQIIAWMQAFGEDTTGLTEQIARLERDTAVSQFLRPARLEELVGMMKRLQAETGLVEVTELSYSAAIAARDEVERQVRLHQKLMGDEVSIIQLESFEELGCAVFLPFYYINNQQTEGPLSYLIIELDTQELAIPTAVLSAHLEAIVTEMKGEAERRRAFALKQLEDAQNLKRRLEDDVKMGLRSEDDFITITHTIDWETLRVIQLPEPEQMRLGDYLHIELPNIIRSAQAQLDLAKRLLEEITKAAEPRGRLAELNQEIIIDSFLRDWDLAFFDEKQAKAYDDWRRTRRQYVWQIIDRWLERVGVNPQVVKQENVVFHVKVREGKALITPYFIANGGSLLFIADHRDGVVRYVNPWALRRMVLLPEGDLPVEVQEKLKRQETWAEARKLLVEPLLSKVLESFENGREQEGGDLLVEALVLNPRGTANWLVEIFRRQQKDTSKEFQQARSEYQKLGFAFFDAFEAGIEYILSKEYAKAIQSFEEAYELRPDVIDSLVWLALAYLWAGNEEKFYSLFERARRLNRGFVQQFEDGLKRGKIIYSPAFEALKDQIDALPFDTRRRMLIIRHIQEGDEHWQKKEFIQAYWEYIEALQLNTEFNEPYQRIVDVYWELGMYRRALEAAFLRLSDPVFGLELQAKPLRISSPNLRWEILSHAAHEKVEKLIVHEEGKTLTILVDSEPVLKLESSRKEEIAHLAQFLAALTAQQISPFGSTTAERLLNTKTPPFPKQRIWADIVFFSEDVGGLVLKAMVYSGAAPNFLAATKVADIETGAPTVKAFLGTRMDKLWETKDIVIRLDYPRSPEERRALKEDMCQYYARIGRNVLSIEISPDAETFCFYKPRTRWEILQRLITGGTALIKPHTTATLPRNLALELVAQLVKGDLFQHIPSAVREALLADAKALKKLEARMLAIDYPQIAMFSLAVQGNTVYLMVLGEGSATKVVPIETKGQDLTGILNKLRLIVNKDPTIPTRFLIQALSDEERELIRDNLVRPLVEHLSPRTKGDMIVLDLRGKDFALLDLPNDPLLRTLVPYFLRGNRLVYISESSTARDIESALRVTLDPRKLKIFIARPSYAFYPAWEDKIAALREKAKRIGVELVDLTDLSRESPAEAKKVLQNALAENESLVLVFGDIGGAKELDLGGGEGSRFTQAEVPEFQRPVLRCVAFAGCKSYATGWSDVVISKNVGEISFGFWEEFIAEELFEFLNRLVDTLSEDPAGRLPALLLLLKLAEELEIPGGVVVELPTDFVKGWKII